MQTRRHESNPDFAIAAFSVFPVSESLKPGEIWYAVVCDLHNAMQLVERVTREVHPLRMVAAWDRGSRSFGNAGTPFPGFPLFDGRRSAFRAIASKSPGLPRHRQRPKPVILRNEEPLTICGRRRRGASARDCSAPPPPVQKIEVLRLRSLPPSPAGNSTQNDRLFLDAAAVAVIPDFDAIALVPPCQSRANSASKCPVPRKTSIYLRRLKVHEPPNWKLPLS